MPEPRLLVELLRSPELCVPVPKTKLWRITAKYLLRPGEFARPGKTPEFEVLALPLPTHRLSSAPSRRGAIDLRIEPAYLAADEETARAEFFSRGNATRYKIWSFEAAFTACLDLTDEGTTSTLASAGVHLTEDHASWVALFEAVWPSDIEAVRFGSYAAHERGGINYAVFRLRPGADYSEPVLEFDAG